MLKLYFYFNVKIPALFAKIVCCPQIITAHHSLFIGWLNFSKNVGHFVMIHNMILPYELIIFGLPIFILTLHCVVAFWNLECWVWAGKCYHLNSSMTTNEKEAAHLQSDAKPTTLIPVPRCCKLLSVKFLVRWYKRLEILASETTQSFLHAHMSDILNCNNSRRASQFTRVSDAVRKQNPINTSESSSVCLLFMAFEAEELQLQVRTVCLLAAASISLVWDRCSQQ